VTLTVFAPDGVPEIRAGDDLAALMIGALAPVTGDIVLVTSKVVSKAEGRALVGTDRASAVESELAEPGARVVARRGPTTIARTRLGLTMAAAGVDASNVAAGTVLLLPVDPDATARRLRRALGERTGVNVAVVVTDTAGRAWRTGQTDIAIGAAGLVVAEDHAGRTDGYGNPLAVTLPAVADELAGAAELAQGKLGGRPLAVVRGRADLVLPPGEDGLGAASLVREEGADLFGYGAREAVVRALAGRDADRPPFGEPASDAELAAALDELPDMADRTAVAAVCFAHGWRIDGWEPGVDEAGCDVVARVSPLTT
jgi:coenzyme F420-0:L-glutamate ligase/coenzyme F420-1:gamma-L-glutamate ligase